jgi:hypothetical protein
MGAFVELLKRRNASHGELDACRIRLDVLYNTTESAIEHDST